MECKAMASGKWMEHAGGPLSRVLIEREANEKDVQSFRSTLFTGPKVFSTERWDFWREKWQAWSAAKAEELGKRSVVNETTDGRGR
jgi:hypothetical protein